jgi:hypothetical protein
MENKFLHRKVMISSIVILILSIAGLIFAFNSVQEYVIATPVVLLLFSIFLIISSLAIRFEDVKWLNKSAKWAVYIFPVSAVGTMIYSLFYGTTLFFWVLIVIGSIMLILALIHLFLFSDSSFLPAMIVFILILLIGIYFKRNRWPLAGAIMTNASCLITIGSFMFGIKCLFIAGKAAYFRNTVFIGSIIISLAYLGQLFKIQHWPLGGFFTYAGFGGLILGTFFILVTLPTSGYIEWDSFLKKKFRNILIPWTFILIMYISRYLVPELNALIWTPDVNRKKMSNYGFTMKDYSVEEKNGIKNK